MSGCKATCQRNSCTEHASHAKYAFDSFQVASGSEPTVVKNKDIWLTVIGMQCKQRQKGEKRNCASGRSQQELLDDQGSRRLMW